MARPEPGEIIKNGADLVSYMVRRREPEIDGDLPSISDLRSKVEEIDAQHPDGNAPEIENVKVSENAKEGLSWGSQSVSEGTACIPCSQDHLSTCSGLLAEALRFARNNGVESTEVISRVGLCGDELNALERVDLRPELTSQLPDWERDIANGVLTGSRDLRHDMAEISSVRDLENVAGRAQALRTHIGEAWLKGRIANMSEEEKAKVREKTEEILHKEVEQ